MIQREKENNLFEYFEGISTGSMLIKEDEEIRPYEFKVSDLIAKVKSEFNQNAVLETDITTYINMLLKRTSSFYENIKDHNETYYNKEYPATKNFCLYECMQIALIDLQDEIINIIYSTGKSNLFNQKRIKECLICDRKDYLIETEDQPATPDTKNSLNWQGTNLQFAELTKALFETKLISPELTQKEFFKRMKHFFNVNEFDEGDKLKEIRGRTNTTTPLLNILETSLNNWIKKKD